MFGISCGFILIGHLLLLASSEVIYKIEKMECKFNPKYVANVSCRLKPINWYKTYANVDSDIIGTIQNISLNAQVNFKNTANRYQPFLINVTSNLCDVLAKRRFPTIATIFVNILKEFSNFNHSCPYSGHVFTKDLYVDSKWTPMPMPLGKYKSNFRFMEGYSYDEIGTVTVYCDVTELQPRWLKTKSPETNKN